MKTKDKDQMIRTFMQENKKEVNDIFFSSKVMQQLPPTHRNKEWIVILFAGLGTLIAWLIGGGAPIQLPELQITEQLNTYYVLAAFSFFPFLILALYYIKEKQIQLL